MQDVAPKAVIFYHSPCTDGSVAEMVARAELEERGFQVLSIPATHGPEKHALDVPESWHGSTVYVVDFWLPRDVLDRVVACSKAVHVLDHHKTAMDEHAEMVREEREALAAGKPARRDGASLVVLLDNDRSGAGLAWDYFHELDAKPRPWYINYVEDHDLFRHALPDSEAVSCFVQSIGLDNIHELPNKTLKEAMHVGRVIQRQKLAVAEAASKAAVFCEVDGEKAAVINVGFPIAQDVLTYLHRNCDVNIAIGYARSGGAWRLSVRSTDASRISAEEFCCRLGGGGHKNAAGATVTDLSIALPTF